MTYNIVDTKADFKNATVTVEITNKNIGQVITAALFKTLQDAFSSKDTNQDSINSYIKDLIDSDSIESKTTTITFNLVKEKGNWKVNANKEELTNAVKKDRIIFSNLIIKYYAFFI